MMKEKKEKSKVEALLSAVKVQINALPIASYISSNRCLVTAQSDKCRSAKWEAADSNPSLTNTQGL